MENIHQFLDQIKDQDKKEKFTGLIEWVEKTFPELELEIKWHQPMFTHHGTFIIAFSLAKAHFSFSPEKETLEVFRDEAKSIGYSTTKMLVKVRWDACIHFDFIEKIINYNIKAKAGNKGFWTSDQGALK